jgi:hypothetical protein
MLNRFAFFNYSFFGIPPFLFIIVGIAFVVFEILMLIHAITNNRIDNTTKVFWVIGILLIHPFVAIGYYIFEYRRYQ